MSKRRKKLPPPPPAVDVARDILSAGPNEYGVQSRSKTALIRSADRKEVQTLTFLRRLAELHYTTTQGKVSLASMAATHPFNEVSLSTLEIWCNEDNWVRKRQDFFSAIADEIKAKIHGAVVASRVEELKSLDKLRQDIYGTLLPSPSDYEDENGVITPPPVKSYEGLVSAFVKLSAFTDQLKDKVAAEIAPDSASSGGGSQVQLSDDDIKAAARAIVLDRQAKLAAKMREESE